MKTKLITTLIALLVIWLVATQFAHADGVAQPSPSRELLVKCIGGPGSEVARAADAAVGCAQVRCFSTIGWHLVRLPDGLSVGEAMAKYRAQPGVLAVEPNVAIHFEPPPPRSGSTGDSPATRLSRPATRRTERA